MSSLSIIMPCYNRAHDLLDTLRAYDRQNGDDQFEVIAVDDASTDHTHQVLAEFYPNRYTLKIERMPHNSGPAAARNRGIELAQAPVILFVGDDIQPHRDLVRGHLVAHRYYPNRGAAILGRIAWPVDMPVNTLMSHIDGVGAQQFSYHFMQDGQELDFRHFYTSNVSIKRELLYSFKSWFDTDFKFAAYEDAELAYRLSRRGLRIIYSSLLLGYHFHYHNIWTFAYRQRKAGLMYNLLVSKHPRLIFFFRAHYRRLLSVVMSIKNLSSHISPRDIDELEYSACQMASFFEWNTNQLLDQFYIDLLNYFYHDGVIQGMFNSSGFRERMRSAHAQTYLRQALVAFIQGGRQLRMNIPAISQEVLDWT